MNHELISAVKQIGKAVIKNSPRMYGRGVIIQNGCLYVTDGFGLIKCKPGFEVGDDRMVDSNMAPLSTSAPRVEPVLPKRDGSTIKPEMLDVVNDAIAIAKGTKTGYIKLSDSVTHSRTDSGGCINVAILNNLLKALPKKAELKEVYLTNYGVYEFVFCEVDEWSIVVVETKENV